MAHNHKAGDSCLGGVNDRPLNFNPDEASILAENIIVPSG
jgi:hypothetical protein